MENIYLPNGYLDMGGILRDPHPFIVVVGSRGCGKTYGTLKACVEEKVKYMYFRRTQKIVDLIMDPAIHIYKRINEDCGLEVEPDLSHGLGRFRRDGEAIGYAAALSTFANVRGFDGSDINLIIYDEFIPEPTERVMFNAYTALLNAVETIGRNRELEGRPPVKTLLLSNSDLIYSDIVAGLGIGDKLLYMQESGVEVLDVSPELLLIRPGAGEFSEKKAETALYKLTRGQQFSEVALANKFPVEDRARINPAKPLREYIPVASIRGICIYRHKNGRGYYVTGKVSGAPKVYEDTEADRRRYLRENPGIWKAYQSRRVWFSGIDTQTVFKSIYE